MDTQSFFASKVPKERIEKVNNVMAPAFAPAFPLNVTSSEIQLCDKKH